MESSGKGIIGVLPKGNHWSPPEREDRLLAFAGIPEGFGEE